MDWLLLFFALFNLISVTTIFAPRSVPGVALPWLIYLFAMLATEFAWFWLPFLGLFVFGLVAAGATETLLGEVSFSIILLSWLGLAWSVRLGLEAATPVQKSLKDGLGADFETTISDERRQLLRKEVSIGDWSKPFRMDKVEIEVLSDIPYGPNGIRQHLDIYRPKQIPDRGCPVLMQIHGGAWMIGQKDHQALPLMHLLASRGWICVSVNYRLSPSVGFPTHLQDCKAALCWIRENGAEYGMDTDFVAVTGGSAGGHMTALMGLTENMPELQPGKEEIDTSVQACVPFYGLYDFLNRDGTYKSTESLVEFLNGRIVHQSPEEAPELWDLASPITHIKDNVCPFMVIHGDKDSLAPVAGARNFAEKLGQVSNNPVVYLELPGAEHAFEILHSPRTEHTINGVQQFLEWTLAHRS